MCRELDSLKNSILAYAGQFDARCLTSQQAGLVMRLCAQMEASVASIKALAAARSAEGKGWQGEGYRSAADQLAHEGGMSPTAARRALDTGRRMTEQPEVARAALGGELSTEQAAAVSQGVAANPGKAKELIEKAKHSSLPELNEEVARTKAAATDQEERRRAIHAKRAFRRWTDRDGALQAHLYGHVEDGADLWRMLDPIRRRLLALRRGDDAHEAFDTLDYDAIMAFAAIASGKEAQLSMADLLDLGLFPQVRATLTPEPAAGGPTPDPSRSAPSQSTDPRLLPGSDESSVPATPSGAGKGKKLAGNPVRIMIRVDLDVLLRGVPLEGELCEIAGYGPVPVSVIQELMANDNPFIVGLLTKGRELVGVYHHGRRPNAYQQSALDFLYPTCAAAGCAARAGLQYDHREDFAKTRFTVFDLLDRLCWHHHALKTRRGWGLVTGTGKRAFVPPDDPRHPRHVRGRRRPGPAPPAPAPPAPAPPAPERLAPGME